MTMVPPVHPDSERLAALAGADPDAEADGELVSHVASCDACGRQVRELSMIRAALGELPDLVPSRPLQLVPPVPAAPVRRGWATAFRRAFAPLAVAGMVLILVGGVGATGALGPPDTGSLLSRFAPASATEPVEAAAPAQGTAPGGEPSDRAGLEVAEQSAEPETLGPAADSDTEAAASDEAEPETSSTEDLAAGAETGGWLALALVGVGLLVAAFVLRRIAPGGTPSGG